LRSELEYFVLDFGHPIPFVDHLGFTLHRMEDGESELRSRSMAYTEARVFDASGRLCSHATGTFKYMPRVARPAAAETTLATD
jgi:acyl-coenzyme A thioesterase PaaI-like protein